MALIKCPDCGNEVSDKAKACIHCGYPIEDMQPQKVEMYEEARKKLYSELSKRMNIPLSYIANIKEVLHIIDSSRVSKEDIVGYYDDPRFNGASLLNTLKSISLEEIPAENIIEFFEGDNVSWKADFSRIVYIGEDQYDDEAIDYEEKERMDLLINSKIEMYKKKMMLNRTSASFTSTLTPSSKGISATTGAIIGGALAGTTGAIIGGLSAYEQRMKSQELLNRHNAILSKYNSEFSNFNQAIVELEQLKKVMPTREIRVKRVLYGLKTNIGLIPFVVRKYEIPGLKDEFVKDYLKDVNMYDIYYQRKLINKDSLANAVKCNSISEIKCINGDAICVEPGQVAVTSSDNIVAADSNNTQDENGNSEDLIVELEKARKIADIVESRVLLDPDMTFALSEEGRVFSTDIINDVCNNGKDERTKVRNWNNIVEIAGGISCIIGLHANGSVEVLADERIFVLSYYEEYIKDIKNWCNVRHIDGLLNTYGILQDGRVKASVMLSRAEPNCGQTDVEYLCDIDSLMLEGNRVIFKKKDGSLVSTKYKRPINIKPEEEVYLFEPWDDSIEEWKNIDKIIRTASRYIGIKADGTLVASRYKEAPEGYIKEDVWPEISTWTDIIDIVRVNDEGFIGLTKHGKLVASDNFINNNKKLWYEIGSWNHVVQLENCLGLGKLVALLLSGAVVTADYETILCDTRQDIPHITDAVGIKARFSEIAIIKKNGTVRVYGDNEKGQCNVAGFKLFDNVDSLLVKVRQRELKQKYDDYVISENLKIEELFLPIKNKINEEYSIKRDLVEAKIRETSKAVKEKQNQLNEQKNSMIAQKDSLGLFKISEKKAIEQKIRELDEELVKIASEKSIRDTYKPEIDTINNQEEQELAIKKDEIKKQFQILSLEEFEVECNNTSNTKY